MAVYTELSESQVKEILQQYDCGDYVAHTGITGGIENTNYFLSTLKNAVRFEWVLTVFERLSHAELPFYLQLTAHLGEKNVAVAKPMATRSGNLHTDFAGKPCAIVQRLTGGEVSIPTAVHCHAVGILLANMHTAVNDFVPQQPNLRGLSWLKQTTPTLFNRVSPAIAALLADELAAQTVHQNTKNFATLPRGAVHADLFCDNVLFDQSGDGSPRAGAIDFYFAGVDTFVFDLAVALNDWCITRSADETTGKAYSSGVMNPALYQALMAGYASQRVLSGVEFAALPMALRATALRFWVSRLDDWYRPRAASQLVPKDPAHFERILRLRRQT